MAPLAVLAAAAEEVEPSKVPFFVAGGLLVVFAVLMSVRGFRTADFPATRGQARGAIGLGAVLVVAAMATAVLTG